MRVTGSARLAAGALREGRQQGNESNLLQQTASGNCVPLSYKVFERASPSTDISWSLSKIVFKMT